MYSGNPSFDQYHIKTLDDTSRFLDYPTGSFLIIVPDHWMPQGIASLNLNLAETFTTKNQIISTVPVKYMKILFQISHNKT